MKKEGVVFKAQLTRLGKCNYGIRLIAETDESRNLLATINKDWVQNFSKKVMRGPEKISEIEISVY